MRLLFREVQKFRQAWIWGIVLFVSALVIYSVMQQVVFDIPFGNNAAPDLVLVIVGALLGFGLPILLYVANLTTEVRAEGLYIRLFPFHLSFVKIDFENIGKCGARTYNPIRDYSGWGIRYGRRGKAYNVSGNRGVELVLLDGKRILVGSQRPEELAEVINTALARRRA